MSNITDWIKYELYPSLFSCVDKALPEFSFRLRGKNWVSTNYRKITGEEGDSKGKVLIWENAPGYIKDFTRGSKGLIDYIIERDGLQFIEAVKYLAEITGLEIPREPNFNPATYQKYKDRENLLEVSNDYFINSLHNKPEAQETIDYLKGRGYSDNDIEAMGLGYIPSQEELFKHLKGKGYSQDLIAQSVKIGNDTRIGSSHKLTIPYRSGGSIKGFKFRTTGQASPKYLNTSGLPIGKHLFNLGGIKGDKDLVIVEGELDSLHATAKGIENIVALTGSNITADQIKDAIRRGAKSFTICLDKEPGKEDKTVKSVYNVITTLQRGGVNKIYIANLPDLGKGKTDPDSLIKEKGIEAFKEIIKKAIPYYAYLLMGIIEKYPEPITPKDIDKLLEEIVGLAVNIPDPLDKDRYKDLFISAYSKGLGVGSEALDLAIERLSINKDKETQDRELRELIIEASKLQSQGDILEAFNLLKDRLKEIKQRGNATEYSKLLIPTQEEQIKDRLAGKEANLNSGYKIGQEELLLPSGAISIIASPTSHGKTSFLVNLALNIADRYPAKEVYLFSYEEDQDTIVLNALNTFINDEIDQYNNRRALKNYYRTGDNKFINSLLTEGGDFDIKRTQFFKELIDTRRLNINYSSYNSDELIEAIRYLTKNANPGAVIIDYIQLLNLPPGKYKTNSRQEELKEVCLALKDIAIETGLPIILGSQFNREVNSPLKLHATKLGEAGDIERVANVILGLWNCNFKALDPAVKDESELKRTIQPGTLYAEILKNRGGRVGSSENLDFNGNTGKIINKPKKNLF